MQSKTSETVKPFKSSNTPRQKSKGTKSVVPPEPAEDHSLCEECSADDEDDLDDLTYGKTQFVLGPEEEDSLENVIALYGPVQHEHSRMICLQLASFLYTPNPKQDEPLLESIKFYISTGGGDAYDMFAMYDMMRLVRNKQPIETIGLGQVMSAGVLLLASGTRGLRTAGKHCQIMLHRLQGSFEGRTDEVHNEHRQMRNMQNAYIQAFVEESTMSEKDIKKLLSRKIDVFLSAEEAKQRGIIDHVL